MNLALLVLLRALVSLLGYSLFDNCHINISTINVCLICLGCSGGSSGNIDSSKFDLIFLLDGSSTVGRMGFEKVKDFTADIASSFNIGPAAVRVGVIAYSRRRTVPRFKFQLNSYSDLKSLRRGITGRYPIRFPYGTTWTDYALRYVRKTALLKANGAREGVPKFVVVVTDGESNDPESTQVEAQLLKDQGVTIFSVGVGIF